MMHSSPLHTLLYLCALPQVFGTLFDLADLQWTLKNRNGSIQIPASGPPSQAHLDLANAGIITEPLLGINGESHATQICWLSAEIYDQTLRNAG